MAGRHVEIRQIDYAEVLRERHAGMTASWRQVVDACLAGDHIEVPQELIEALVDGTTTSEELAATVGQFDIPSDLPGPGVADRTAALVGLLRGIARAVAERSPGQREEVMQRLAVALGRLSPDMMLAVVTVEGRAATPIDVNLWEVATEGHWPRRSWARSIPPT